MLVHVYSIYIMCTIDPYPYGHAAMKLRDTCSLEESYGRPRHNFANKGPYSESHGFSSSHVQLWALDHKEGWAPKNWCFHTVLPEKTLENPLDCKEIKPVNPKGNQSWIFNGRTDAEAETPILWPCDAKSQFIGKDPDARKDWGQEEKGVTEVRWLDDITNSMDMSLNKLWETAKGREAWCAAVHGVTKSRTWLSNWKTTERPHLHGLFSLSSSHNAFYPFSI